MDFSVTQQATTQAGEATPPRGINATGSGAIDLNVSSELRHGRRGHRQRRGHALPTSHHTSTAAATTPSTATFASLGHPARSSGASTAPARAPATSIRKRPRPAHITSASTTAQEPTSTARAPGEITIDNSTSKHGPFTVYGGGAGLLQSQAVSGPKQRQRHGQLPAPLTRGRERQLSACKPTPAATSQTPATLAAPAAARQRHERRLRPPGPVQRSELTSHQLRHLPATWISQAGDSFLAGLDSSSTGTPTFRAIAAGDVPT